MESYGIGQSVSRFEDPRRRAPNAGLQRIGTAVILSLRLHFNSLKTLQAILLLEFLQQFYSLTD